MKIFYQLAFFVLLVVVFGACRGDQQKKLIGYWEQVSFTDPEETPKKKYWEFYAGDALTVFTYVGEEVSDSMQLTYSISGTVFEVFSGADDRTYLPAARDPRGEYWVDDLNDSQFKATKRKHPDGSKEGVYVRVELVKR
jgi:hypothetical protein